MYGICPNRRPQEQPNRLVRTGEEVIICDRKSPIAKIVRLSAGDFDLEERELIAKGLMHPAQKPFDAEAFFAIGRGLLRRTGTKAAIDRAMAAEREGIDVSVLGRKRTRTRVRARSNL
jgi:antitoxin (DNA-binding transcriptional repressor) of toxin-antitoxin stability system